MAIAALIARSATEWRLARYCWWTLQLGLSPRSSFMLPRSKKKQTFLGKIKTLATGSEFPDLQNLDKVLPVASALCSIYNRKIRRGRYDSCSPDLNFSRPQGVMGAIGSSARPLMNYQGTFVS